MKIMRFGSYYINLDEFIYAQKFSAKVLPVSAVRARNVGGVSIGLKAYELPAALAEGLVGKLDLVKVT
jgi:hypothetical protein